MGEVTGTSRWHLDIREIKPTLEALGSNDRRFAVFAKFIEDSVASGLPCLQIGVPSDREDKYGPNWTAIDLYDMRPCIDHHVNICNKWAMVPFYGRFHYIVCNALLEHVKDPIDAGWNLSACLDQGGMLYTEVPFIWDYHPHGEYDEDRDGMLHPGIECLKPHGGDYWRFTPQGIRQVFESLELVDLFIHDLGGVTFIGKKAG